MCGRDDWVMLKVDVEGAEYNLIPCLAQFSTMRQWFAVVHRSTDQSVGGFVMAFPKTNCQGEAGMVDRMYLEEHWWFPSITASGMQYGRVAKVHCISRQSL